MRISIDLDLKLNSPQKVENKIADFIKSKIEETGSETAVLGLSGGLDSAVVASLAVKALEKRGVCALLMPDKVTNPGDIKHAEKLVNLLDIESKIIEIDSTTQAFLNLLPEAKEDRIACGNLKARIRMSLLYLYANLNNGLVLGTGNRSEILLGYFTKYGDGACDILPIGDLYKVQTRELAKWLEIPEPIINKPPSAGFWPDQTDRKELGASYEVLDPILHLLTERNLSPAKIAEELEVELSLVVNIQDRWIENRHKRNQPPTPSLGLKPRL